MTPKQLFMALDGRTVTSAEGGRFKVSAYSVVDDNGRRWIQLSLKGAKKEFMLTVRLTPADGAQHVVLALTSWLANPGESSDIFNVA